MRFHLSFILHFDVTQLMSICHCTATLQGAQTKAVCWASWGQGCCIPCCCINVTKGSWRTCTHLHTVCRHRATFFNISIFSWQIGCVTVRCGPGRAMLETTLTTASQSRNKEDLKWEKIIKQTHNIKSLQIVGLTTFQSVQSSSTSKVLYFRIWTERC